MNTSRAAADHTDPCGFTVSSRLPGRHLRTRKQSLDAAHAPGSLVISEKASPARPGTAREMRALPVGWIISFLGFYIRSRFESAPRIGNARIMEYA